MLGNRRNRSHAAGYTFESALPSVVDEDRRGPGQRIVRVLRRPIYLLFRRSSAVCWSGEVRGCPWLCGVVDAEVERVG